MNNASVSWTVERGAVSVATQDERLIISTPLTGAAHLSGEISDTAGNLVGALGGILNQGLGQDLQRITGRTIGQDAGFCGNLTITSRPALTPNWRLEPNLSGQVSITRASLTFAGVPIEVGDQVKPMLDHSIDEQMVEFQSWLQNNPLLEQRHAANGPTCVAQFRSTGLEATFQGFGSRSGRRGRSLRSREWIPRPSF